MTDYKALVAWALSRRTGASSICIAAHLSGNTTDGSYPSDGGDFGRCEGLLDAVPGLRGRLSEMAEVNRYWAALVPRWDEIRAAEDKSALIRSILRPVEDGDPGLVRLSEGVTMRVGRIK